MYRLRTTGSVCQAESCGRCTIFSYLYQIIWYKYFDINLPIESNWFFLHSSMPKFLINNQLFLVTFTGLSCHSKTTKSRWSSKDEGTVALDGVKRGKGGKYKNLQRLRPQACIKYLLFCNGQNHDPSWWGLSYPWNQIIGFSCINPMKGDYLGIQGEMKIYHIKVSIYNYIYKHTSS